MSDKGKQYIEENNRHIKHCPVIKIHTDTIKG